MENSLILYFKRSFSGTFLSRASGMVRDLMMAYAFGDHASVAAFIIAFRFSNLFRRLLGEGPFQSAFIPYFEGIRVKDQENASFFFRKLVLLISLFLLIATIFVEGGLTTILSMGTLNEGSREIAILMGWLFPGILFICLYGLNISLLNCYGSFFVPSFAPFVCNVIWITAAYLLRHQSPDLAMPILAKWIVIGFVGQWLFTLPHTLKYVAAPWKEWLEFKVPKEVKDLAKSFSLGAIGVGATQINGVFDAIFARYASLQGPAYLWYSIRLQQLAFALFGVACVSTIVPRMSRLIKNHYISNAHRLFSLSFKRIMLILIPCTFAILALGAASVNFVYGRGNFSELAIVKTTICLWTYGLGLVPMTLVMLFSAVCYAQNNFRTPMLISLLTVAINIGLSSLFVFYWHLGPASTALSTSLSAGANSYLLYRVINKTGWESTFSGSQISKIVFASLFGLFCVYAVDLIFFHSNTVGIFFKTAKNYPTHLTSQLVYLFTLFFTFIGGVILYAFGSKNRSFLQFFKELIKSASLSEKNQKF